jgi:hypothetical protein
VNLQRLTLYETINFITRFKAQLTATILLYAARDFMVYLWLPELSDRDNRESVRAGYCGGDLYSLKIVPRQRSCVLSLKYKPGSTVSYLFSQ